MRNAFVSSVTLALVLVQGALPQTTARAKHRVVFQMTEPEGPAWDDLTVRVNNLLANLLPDGGAQVEIVFFGRGLNMLRKTNVSYQRRFEDFVHYGVVFAACQNSMAAMKHTAADLFPFASQVRSGVVEVVRKQEAGWAYVH